MSPRHKFVVAMALLAVPVAALIGYVAQQLSKRADLPNFGTVPPFALTERSGKILRLEDLKGKPWVASFLLTRCSGQCPLLAAKLRELQKDGTQLVSFSVDPENDTPEVLAAYAKREKADEKQWLFVTGPRPELEQLFAHGFHIAGGLNHSSHFVLVDSSGNIRGFYDANDAEALRRLRSDVLDLRPGKSS